MLICDRHERDLISGAFRPLLYTQIFLENSYQLKAKKYFSKNSPLMDGWKGSKYASRQEKLLKLLFFTF